MNASTSNVPLQTKNKGFIHIKDKTMNISDHMNSLKDALYLLCDE